MVQRRLTAAVEGDNGFEAERWAVAALGALTAGSLDARSRGHYTPSASQIEAVVTTCRAIEASPARPLTVADRALAVGMTSTRLTHAFARYLGVSPHQYVVRWRLATAAGLLDAGYSVSTACYRAGFENLSHFCRAFRRTLGSRPSLWRTISLPERRRKVQAMLGGAL
jgi:AraC-like DNA-binding protein